MKRIEALNGYTIMQATARDVNKYNVEEGMFYIYFSSDLRDYGLAFSYADWECDSLEVAREWCSGTNFALAREIVEASTTAASFEEIERVEKMLDAGIAAEEIENEEIVSVIEENGMFYVHIENRFEEINHGPYFTRAGAKLAAENYKKNPGGNTQ
jgi:hypothetical protein